MSLHVLKMYRKSARYNSDCQVKIPLTPKTDTATSIGPQNIRKMSTDCFWLVLFYDEALIYINYRLASFANGKAEPQWAYFHRGHNLGNMALP